MALHETISKLKSANRKFESIEVDPTKVLDWRSTEKLGEFHTLVSKPPVHSVVAKISPAFAEALIELTNSNNRPVTKNHELAISRMMEAGFFDITGDTIKFDVNGVLIDGQHRLLAAIKANQTLITHIVFGLDPSIFDILDQGRKRSPGDVLAIAGIQHYNMMAACIRWIYRYDNNAEWPKRSDITPRQIRELAQGKYKDADRFFTHAILVSQAFKHPPSMVAGILYIIGKQGTKGLAESFVDAWVHGARIGRNQTFDALNKRFQEIQRQNGGHINPNVRAASIITAFNYWNADLVVPGRALHWRPGLTFPRIEVNPDKFKKHKSEPAKEMLAEKHFRVLTALVDHVGDGGITRLSWSAICEHAKVHMPEVGAILRALEDHDHIEIIAKGSGGGSGAYRVTLDSKKK